MSTPTRKYLCAAPRQNDWGELEEKVLSRLGPNAKESLEATLTQLRTKYNWQLKSGPGRKSNAEHALHFYEYLLEKVTAEEADGEAEAVPADEDDEGEDVKAEAVKEGEDVGTKEDEDNDEDDASADGDNTEKEEDDEQDDDAETEKDGEEEGDDQSGKDGEESTATPNAEIQESETMEEEEEETKTTPRPSPERKTQEAAASSPAVIQHQEKCAVCEDVGDEVAKCSTCDLIFHLPCARPVMEELPSDPDWRCAYCVLSTEPKNTRRRRDSAAAVRLMARLRNGLKRRKAGEIEDDVKPEATIKPPPAKEIAKSSNAPVTETGEPVKRKRGRPKKVRIPSPEPEPEVKDDEDRKPAAVDAKDTSMGDEKSANNPQVDDKGESKEQEKDLDMDDEGVKDTDEGDDDGDITETDRDDESKTNNEAESGDEMEQSGDESGSDDEGGEYQGERTPTDSKRESLGEEDDDAQSGTDRSSVRSGDSPRRKRNLELSKLADAFTGEVDSPGGRGKRNRKQPTLYDPQLVPARHWQSDEVNHSSDSDSETDDASDSDDNSEHSKESTKAEDDTEEPSSPTAAVVASAVEVKDTTTPDSPRARAGRTSTDGEPWCTFCGDDPVISICCFCACRKCFCKDNKEKLLLCDECDEEYHIYCLDPPLSSIPAEKKWYCPSCVAEKEKLAAKPPPRSPTRNKVGRPPSSDSPRKVGRPPSTDGPRKVGRPPNPDGPRKVGRPPNPDGPRKVGRPRKVDRLNSEAPRKVGRPPNPDGPRKVGRPPNPDGPRKVGRPRKVDRPSSESPRKVGRPPSTDGPRKVGRPPNPDGPRKVGRPPKPDGPRKVGRPPNPDGPRKVGRPRKSDEEKAAAKAERALAKAAAKAGAPTGRKRGRPPKNKDKEDADVPSPKSKKGKTGRKRGRPPKIQIPEEQPKKKIKPPQRSSDGRFMSPATKKGGKTGSGSKADKKKAAEGNSKAKSPTSTKGNPPIIQQPLLVANMPVVVSRSGRTVKRSSFHDEIDEGEQHLKTYRQMIESQNRRSSSVGQRKLSPAQKSALSQSGEATSIEESESFDRDPLSEHLDLADLDDLEMERMASHDGSLKLPGDDSLLIDTGAHSFDSIPGAKLEDGSIDLSGFGLPLGDSRGRAAGAGQFSIGEGGFASASAGASADAESAANSRTPRRKPGARECMQISRRFGVRVIPEKYIEILTDYCNRGKVEHLIRMRERLDEHSRYLEAQLAGLESLVKAKGESTIVVPALPEGPDRKLERTMAGEIYET